MNDDRKNTDKKLLTNEGNIIRSDPKEEIIRESNQINNENQDNTENQDDNNIENIDNHTSNQGAEGVKPNEEGISLKLSKTKELTIQKKEPIEALRFKMIILEAIVICGIIGISVIEISSGLNIYTNYQVIKSRYYYETIQYYIRNLDYVFDVTINQTDICEGDYTYMEFSEIGRIDGVCITKNKLKDLFPDDPTVSTYLMDFENDGTKKCYANSLNLDRTVFTNYWANFYYCQVSYPQSYISFYFLSTNNNTKCYDDDLLCGKISDYLFCMYIILKDKTNVNTCPYTTIVREEDYVREEGQIVQEFFLNDKRFFFLRGVSDKYNGFYFSFRANYGEVSHSAENDTLSSEYTNYEINSNIDFSDTNRYSVLTEEGDIDKFGGFFNNYFEPILIQKNIKNFGSIQVGNPPYHFSMRYKQNYLPDASCFDILDSKDSLNRDFLNNIDLFLEHIQISAPRYVAWTILEITFIGIFYVYLRGFIIFNEWLGKITLKIDDVEMRNEIFTEIEINLFSVLIMILKFINNYVQLGNIKNNLTTSERLSTRDCFKNDLNIYNSLRLYNDDVKILYDFTMFSIYMMGIHLASVFAFGIVKWIYLNKKRNYIEQEKIKAKDTKKTK